MARAARMVAVQGVVLAILALAAGDAAAAEMKATIYDDGVACPGGCDAHVVFHPSHNGTANAFRPPLASRQSPSPCVNGEACVVCFGEAEKSCIEALYRGSGPPRGKFDFTPEFFRSTCPRDDLPAALRRTCDDLAAGVARYRQRLNCFDRSDHPLCADLMADAARAQCADRVEYELCRALGQDEYNRRQDDPEKRRSLGCRYSLMKLGGPNSAGVRWKILLPASCRAGTYVGRFGTDCCSNNLYAAAGFHPECAKYFPERPEQPGE